MRGPLAPPIRHLSLAEFWYLAEQVTLRRVGTLFDVSLDEPDDRLSAWMQLRLAAH